MDLRVKKTRKSIVDAFIELRQIKPLEKITVKELASKAMINKATFYLHYQDIYDLEDSLESELISSVLSSISDKNLYVEIQGNWTHGPHPFDKNNKEDISILNNWKEKNTPYYLSAIKNWTINDPHKREVAKNNKLNFLEIFTQDVNDLIKKFNDYYEQL